MTPCRPLSFWMDARMPYEKARKRNSNTEWRIYYSDDVLPSSSPQKQILHVRSGWRLTLSSLWRLTVPGYSEWAQECCLRKTGNGTVTQSEESITRMTPYRPPSSQKQILHIRSGWRLTLSSLWRLAVPGHSERGQECHMRKAGKRDSDTEWRIYYADDILPLLTANG